RMSVQFSPSFRTCAPLAGPGVYCSRSVIFFSLSSFSLVLTHPCGRGGVREHQGEWTRADGTEPARHPHPEVAGFSRQRYGRSSRGRRRPPSEILLNFRPTTSSAARAE